MSGGKRLFMTGEEKVHLKELVCSKSDIIECKRTDAISIVKKKRAWAEIAAEFNAAYENSNRNIEQLRKCWENMKSRRRKELSIEKTCRMLTGGGGYEPPSQDDIDTELDETLALINASAGIMGTEQYSINDGILMDEQRTNPTNHNEGNDSEPIAGPSSGSSQRALKNKSGSNISRGTAIERELDIRLKRTEQLMEHDKELHSLKMREQQIKVEEQELRVAIAKEILAQEKIKTEKLKNG